MEVRAMTQEEQKYTFRQSMQIEMQTTQVGYLRGYFGKDGEFYTEWFDRNKARKTDLFMSEFNEVITAGRENGAGLPLHRRKALRGGKQPFPYRRIRRTHGAKRRDIHAEGRRSNQSQTAGKIVRN